MVKIVYHVPIAQEGVMKMKMENVIIKMKDAMMNYIMGIFALICVLIKMKIVQNVKEMEIVLNVKMNIIMEKIVRHVRIVQVAVIRMIMEYVMMKIVDA